MHDTDDIGSNPTDNPHLDDLIRVRLNRRQVPGGGLAAAAVGFFGRGLLGAAPAAAGISAVPSTANPRAVSNWPDHDPDGRPRSATVAIRRMDGGKVGS